MCFPLRHKGDCVLGIRRLGVQDLEPFCDTEEWAHLAEMTPKFTPISVKVAQARSIAQTSPKFTMIRRAAKGGTQKGVGHFFFFGHLFVTFCHFFLTLLVTFLPIPFCLPLFAAG